MRRREGASAAGTVAVVDDFVAACLGASQRIPTLAVRPSARAQVYAERRVGNGGRSHESHTTLSLAAMAARVVRCIADYGRGKISDFTKMFSRALALSCLSDETARSVSAQCQSHRRLSDDVRALPEHFGYSTVRDPDSRLLYFHSRSLARAAQALQHMHVPHDMDMA